MDQRSATNLPMTSTKDRRMRPGRRPGPLHNTGRVPVDISCSSQKLDRWPKSCTFNAVIAFARVDWNADDVVARSQTNTMIPFRGPPGRLRSSASPFGLPVRKQYYYAANGIRPRLSSITIPAGRRKASAEAGEDDSGHIKTQQNEGIFFFDSTLHGSPHGHTLMEGRCISTQAPMAQSDTFLES